MDEKDWVWVRDTQWSKLGVPRRCRYIGGHPRTVCHNMASFALLRSNGYWAYCEEHMYGRRIRDGIVEVQVYPDSPAAKRGYA